MVSLLHKHKSTVAEDYGLDWFTVFYIKVA